MTNSQIASANKIIYNNTEASAMYIGNTLMWNKGPLPVRYTQLEYIKSTSSGGQYIDLNIQLYDTLNKSYDLAIKFNLIGPGQDNYQPTLFGCQTITTPWPGTFIRMSQLDHTYVTGRYIGANTKDNNLGDINTIIELPVQTLPNKNLYNLNNSNRTHTWGTSLFCTFNNQNKTEINRFCEAKLYYFKLFVEGTLVRDMVPCKDPNNVVGLYDLVNNVFYSSPNGAAFVAGPEI